MIIACERCQTRFQLDDAQIPARGARVRCSRCKHAFFVRLSGATPDEVAREVAAVEAESASTAPAPSLDLTGAEPPGFGAEGEEAWEFDEEAPGERAAASDASHAQAAGERDLRPEPAPSLPALGRPSPPQSPAGAASPLHSPSALDDLGDPEEWDFLPQEDGRKASGEGRSELEEGAQEAPAVRQSPVGQTPAQEVALESDERLPPLVPPLERASRSYALLGRAALVLAGGLLVLGWTGVVQGLWSSSTRRSLQPDFALQGRWARHVRLRRVENAQAGLLAVVTGEIESAGPEVRGIRVQWTAGGSPLPEAETLAGPPLPDRWLRLAIPSQLEAQLQARSAEPLDRLAQGQDGAFLAVFEGIPPEADGLRVAPLLVPGP